MKVKAYRTAKFKNYDVLDVDKISAMPEPDKLTEDDRDCADGVMLTLYCSDGRVIWLPHCFIIEITD